MPHAARAEITLQAPLERVFELLVDFSAYRRWNPFVVDVTGARRAAEGVQMRFRLRWREGRYISSDEQVTRIHAPADGAALVAWRYDSPLARWGLLRSERVQTLTRLPNGHTAYTTEAPPSSPCVGCRQGSKLRRGPCKRTCRPPEGQYCRPRGAQSRGLVPGSGAGLIELDTLCAPAPLGETTSFRARIGPLQRPSAGQKWRRYGAIPSLSQFRPMSPKRGSVLQALFLAKTASCSRSLPGSAPSLCSTAQARAQSSAAG
ncbi:SRPBCC family protein [Deinococcus sp. Leaf326]|uniref:SRPBCC family protein n=1 Tax=Deinococcus sp. Leaf326 TaxID=1736338 RepID=UPI0012E2B8D2